ncbi:hypothetical protein JCM6882_007125 [Rhodosporidiobolus microsporus]
MASRTATQSLKAFLERAVARGAAPGLSAVAFNRTSAFASAATGVASLQTNAPLTLDTSLWFASASKSVISLAVLSLVERHGFDLDSHKDLVKLIPELGKDYPGSQLWKIFDGKDGNGGYKYREAEKGITLRHLLTHSSGLSADFMSEETAWFCAEAAKKAGGPIPFGLLESYNLPRMFEAGENFHYGRSPGYLTLFVQRQTGMSLRRALQDLVFKPFGLEKDLDIFYTDEMRADKAETVFHAGPTFVSMPFVFEPPQYEDMAPEGELPLGDGPVVGKLPAFAEVLRSYLNKTAPSPNAKPLLSAEMWEKATADDMKARGIDIPQKPFLTSVMPMGSSSVDVWASPKDENGDNSLGWTLMQTLYHRHETKAGVKPGSLEWAGIANTYYFVDPVSGLGGVITSQFFPFADAGMIDLKEEFFAWVRENAEQ